jgi:predicted transcriptional regulator
METRLDKIEADPAFQEMMQRSDEDIRAGRVVSHEEVKGRLRRKHSKKR